MATYQKKKTPIKTAAQKSVAKAKSISSSARTKNKTIRDQIADNKAPVRTGITPNQARRQKIADEVARSRRKGTNAMKTEVRDNNNNWTMGKVTGSDRRRIWNYEQKYTK